MARIGINRRTGAILKGWPHTVQSIEDIVTTRVMTRVMRRPYGARVPSLVDAPTNESSLMEVRVALAEALAAWEPGFELKTVAFVSASASGRASILLSGIEYPNGHRGDRTPASGVDRTVQLFQLNETTWRAAA